MDTLKNLEPAEVFQYFEEICAIPHGSGNTGEISDYLVKFAENHGLLYRRDEAGNVVVRKAASPGYEKAPVTILQGHMDMVCEKDASVRHDFLTQGLTLHIMDDYLYAGGTTLGGDDGIALAYILAVLADDSLPHPGLEAVFTVDEEIGMLGAISLDTADLDGKFLINIDSEEEGILWTSCAGGVRAMCSVPVRYTQKTGENYKIIVSGLKGGHSGTDIDKERGNANIVMGRLLHFLGKSFSYDLISLSGGLQDNAIPREAEAQVLVHKNDTDRFEATIAEFESIMENEYRASESNITIYCEETGKSHERVLTPKTKERIIFLLMTLPDGVQRMSLETSGLVQTSLNLGIMRLTEKEFISISAIRSSISSEKYALCDKLRYLTESIGGTYSEKGDYPAWEYKKDSRLRDIMVCVYEELYGKKPLLRGVHAGLECGIFYKKMPALDMISFGPDILDIHTPKEHMSISSVGRTWEYLLKVLKKIGA